MNRTQYVLSAAAIIMFTAASAHAAVPELVASWSFDEASGISTFDGSGKGNDATLEIGLERGAGKFGSGLSFVSGGERFAEIGNSAKIDNSEKGTIAAWIYNLKNPGSGTILSYGGHGEETMACRLRDVLGSYYIDVRNGGAGVEEVRGTTVIPNETWHHVACVSDGMQWLLYVDGVQETLEVMEGTNTGDWFADTTPLETDHSRIGEQFRKDEREHRFVGTIDEVRVYNRALSAAEIQYVMTTSSTTATSDFPPPAPATPPPAPTPPAAPPPAAVTPPATPPAPVPPPAAPAYTFTRDMSLGSRGTDVKELQKFLNAKGFSIAPAGPGSVGNETEYFGPATKAALVKFQDANKEAILAPAGLTAGTGYFGPGTRKKVNELMADTATPAPMPMPPASQNTQIQALLEQIKTLQEQLNALQKK